MLEEYCGTCGSLESNHQANQADTQRYVEIVRDIMAGLPEEQAKVLDEIFYDWRTHTLPACDPLAVD